MDASIIHKKRVTVHDIYILYMFTYGGSASGKYYILKCVNVALLQ